VPRPHIVLGKALSAAPVMCVAVSNITASYAKRKRRKTPALRVRTRDRYVLRPAGKCRHTSQGQRPSPSSRVSKTGLVLRRPFAFCCSVVPVYVLSCCGRFAAYVGGAFPLTPPIPPAAKLSKGMAAPVRTATPCLGQTCIPAHGPLACALHRPLVRAETGKARQCLFGRLRRFGLFL